MGAFDPHIEPQTYVALRPRYVDRDTAARYLCVGATRLKELVNEGAIVAKRPNGGKLIYDVASLDAYLDGLPQAKEMRE